MTDRFSQVLWTPIPTDAHTDRPYTVSQADRVADRVAGMHRPTRNVGWRQESDCSWRLANEVSL